MIKRTLFVSILISVFLLLACKPTPIPDNEDYAVYSAMLRQFSGDSVQIYVIEDQTNLSFVETGDPEFLSYLQENEPAITEEMYDSYLRRNQESAPLERNLDLPAEYIYITTEEFQQYFADAGNDGWDEFYRQYPGSGGIIYLSRPGYNAAGDKAIVYFGNQGNYLAGVGLLVYMEKVDGEWQVINQVMIWIS